MVRKFSISILAPYLALLACVWSILFPSRDLRLVRSLRSEVDALRADNTTLRNDIAGVVRFIRDELPGVLSAPDSGGGGAVPDGAAPSKPESVAGGRYMVSRGVPGFSVGSDWWLVGEMSPWGVVDNAFRGGFSADGRLYSFVSSTPELDDLHVK